MKETHEFRINNKRTHLLSQPLKTVNNGMCTVIKITRENRNFQLIQRLNEKMRAEGDWFFIYSEIKRIFTKK